MEGGAKRAADMVEVASTGLRGEWVIADDVETGTRDVGVFAAAEGLLIATGETLVVDLFIGVEVIGTTAGLLPGMDVGTFGADVPLDGATLGVLLK